MSGLKIGSVLRGLRTTRERMRWYVDVQPTVAHDDGRIHTQEPTIHDDDDYAKSQGLPGIIADGMVSTNWIMGLLLDTFGVDFARKGKLRTKYIAPIYEGDQMGDSRARHRDRTGRRRDRVSHGGVVRGRYREEADGGRSGRLRPRMIPKSMSSTPIGDGNGFSDKIMRMERA